MLRPYYILVFVLFLFSNKSITAQESKSHYDKLPWIKGEFPQKKGPYEFLVSTGEGPSLKQAREDAFNFFLIDLGNKAGVSVNSQTLGEIKSSLEHKNGNQSYEESSSYVNKFKIEREDFKASFIKVSEYYEITDVGGSRRYNIWELYQLSTDGNEFIPQIPEYTYIYGSKALFRSAVLPGWGQFYKKKTGKGVAIIAAEVGLISGLVFSEMKRSDNQRKSHETTNIQQIKEYRKRVDSWETNRNLFLGGAIGVYVFNLLDAALSKGQIKYAWIQDNIDLMAYNQDETINIGLKIKF